MPVEPIHTQSVVPDALGLSDCRGLSHGRDRLKNVREAREPRQESGRIRSPAGLLGRTAVLILALLGPLSGRAYGISPGEAAQHVGQAVTIEGFVQQVMCSPRACLLSFQAGWAGFVATIPGESRGGFPDPKTYERQTVRLRGVVEDRQGRLRLELTDPSRIELVGSAAAEKSSRVKSATAKPVARSDGANPPQPDVPQRRTNVEVSGGLRSGASGSQLGTIVRDLQEEAAVSGTDGAGASEMAVQGLRERVAMQSHTIQTLEQQLNQVNGRLQELEDRPVVELPSEPALHGVPEIEEYVVPSRRGFKEAHPRTGWSVDRLVRELGPPLEVHVQSRDVALWIYGPRQSVTVKRGRVRSVSGF